MTLAQDILGSNADIEAGEAAYLIGGYAAGCGDPAGVLAGRDGRGAPLLDMLIDEDVLREAPRLYRWDVPRVCRVLLGRGRNGAVLTEASAMRVLPSRARAAGVPGAGGADPGRSGGADPGRRRQAGAAAGAAHPGRGNRPLRQLRT